MIDFIPGAMEETARSRGKVYKGKARFVGSNAIEVNGERLEADNIVIATGSITRPLSIPGAEHLITSDEVLSESELPEEVVFIGGGVIAMEFSHVYARAGARVTILEAMPQLLPRLDQDAVAAIQGESERLGIDVKTAVEVEAGCVARDVIEITYTESFNLFRTNCGDTHRQLLQTFFTFACGDNDFFKLCLLCEARVCGEQRDCCEQQG